MNPEIEKSLRDSLVKKIEGEMTEKGFLVAGHGTSSKEVADKILTDGIIGNPSYGLYEMTLPLSSSDTDARGNAEHIVDQSLHWKHKDARFVMLVAVRPDISRKEMLVDEVEVNGNTRSRIPPRFIRGYIDALNISFVSNPQFEENAAPVVQQVLPPRFSRPKSEPVVDIPTPSQTATDEDVW